MRRRAKQVYFIILSEKDCSASHKMSTNSHLAKESNSCVCSTLPSWQIRSEPPLLSASIQIEGVSLYSSATSLKKIFLFYQHTLRIPWVYRQSPFQGVRLLVTSSGMFPWPLEPWHTVRVKTEGQLLERQMFIE